MTDKQQLAPVARASEMDFSAQGIPASMRPAFQEYDLDRLDLDRDAFTIIERTLAYGQREEPRWLFSQYGVEKLANWVSQAGWRFLPRRRLNFWSLYFNLPDLPERQEVWNH